MSAGDAYQYQLLPDLSPEDFAALKADIATRGVQVPVEIDETGARLDGHQRVRAWAELRADGVDVPDYPRVIRAGLTEDEKFEHALVLNLNRRHLTVDQRRELSLKLRDRGWSNTRIADLEHVDETTVRRDLESGSAFAEPDRVIGKDGKSYPAHRPPPTSVLATSERQEQQVLSGIAAAGDALPSGWVPPATVGYTAKEGIRAQTLESNRRLVLDAVPVPDGTFSAIVIDPPWDWGDEGDVSQFGRGSPVYATMPLDELMDPEKVPVEAKAEPNAHLYLWITNRSLPKGFALMEHWGFRYVTMLTWCKPTFGLGNYFRGQTEHVLFGVRGSLELLQRDVGTWHEWPRGDVHSAKPDAFFTLVEQCSPGPWLEMFARKRRPGWFSWGAELQ